MVLKIIKKICDNKKNNVIIRSSTDIVKNVSSGIISDSEQSGVSELNANISLPKKVGFWFTCLFFFVFCSWAVFAPFTGSVVATGVVTSSIKKQIIQNLEGGIIEQILVRDGDWVRKGDGLIKLSSTELTARKEILLARLYALKIQKARLLAERENKNVINLSVFFKDDSKLAANKELLQSQQNILQARQNNINGQVEISKNRIDGINEEIVGLTQQLLSVQEQLLIINDQISTAEKLVNNGYADKNKLIYFLKERADINGKIGYYNSSIGRAKQKINEIKTEVYNMKNMYMQEVNNELKEIEINIAEHEEKFKVVKDSILRSVVVAPYDGVVSNIKYYSKGGVVGSGAPIMEIVPDNRAILVEAKLSPRYINSLLLLGVDLKSYGRENSDSSVVIKGKVRIISNKARSAPALNVFINRVSSDIVVDEKTGFGYYIVSAVITEQELTKFQNVFLYPGMMVELFITTGRYNFASYLLGPIISSFDKAFLDS